MSLRPCWVLWWRARWTTRGSRSCRHLSCRWPAESVASSRAARGTSRSPPQRPSRPQTQNLTEVEILILALFSRYSHPQLPHTVQLQKSAPKASKEDPNQWISRSILSTNICLYLILVLVLHNKTRANTGLRYQLLNVPLSTYLGHNPLITKFQGCLSIYYYIIYIYYSIYRYQIMSLTVATSQIQKWVWLWSKACLFFSEKIFIFSMIKNYNVNGYFCNTFQNGV